MTTGFSPQRTSFDQRYSVGPGYRAMLHGCPRDLIVRSAIALRDEEITVSDAFEELNQAALDSGSALLRLRVLDLAQQLPADDARRDRAITHHATALMVTTADDMASDRTLVAISNKWASTISRTVGLSAYHLIDEGMISVGAVVLETAERLGLEHDTLDSARERLRDVEYEYGDDEDQASARVMNCTDGLRPRYAPRGTWNKHASPAWARALDS